MRSEKLELNLQEFNLFYELIITYTMSSSRKFPKALGEEDNLAQRNSVDAKGRESSMNEDKICVICFEKPVQIVLPCYV